MNNTRQVVKLDLSALHTESTAYPFQAFSTPALNELLYNEYPSHSGGGPFGKLISSAVKSVASTAMAQGKNAVKSVGSAVIDEGKNAAKDVANDLMQKTRSLSPKKLFSSSHLPKQLSSLSSTSSERPSSPKQSSFPNRPSLPKQSSFPNRQSSFPNRPSSPKQSSFTDMTLSSTSSERPSSFPNRPSSPKQSSFPNRPSLPKQSSFPNRPSLPKQSSFTDMSLSSTSSERPSSFQNRSTSSKQSSMQPERQSMQPERIALSNRSSLPKQMSSSLNLAVSSTSPDELPMQLNNPKVIELQNVLKQIGVKEEQLRIQKQQTLKDLANAKSRV